MTKQYIAESNKIIAEFDGWKHGGKKGNLANMYNKNGEQVHSDNFQYHKSWDWLLPVYKKLATKLYAKRDEIKSDKGTTWVSKQEPISHIESCDSAIRCEIWGVRINDAFHGIVETIKMYNAKRWS